jgi:hypothetical protein
MRDALYFAGLILTTIGAGVAVLTSGTATGAFVAIFAGIALCMAAHKPGVHGPGEG